MLRTAGRRLALMSLIVAGSAGAVAAGNVDLPRFPSISPDGSQIVFSWRGDLWKVAAAGGSATRLTSHPGNDTVSAWSPGGSRIAFNSDRSGFVGIHLMNPDGTDIRAVTDSDRECDLAAFGNAADGTPIVMFDSTLDADNYRSPRPFKVGPAGGDLLRVHDAFGRNPVPSPDGTAVAFTRGGADWRRRHYTGPDSRDVWLYHVADGRFTRVTDAPGNDGMARWQDDRTLLFASDRELERVNVYRQQVGSKTAERLTSFRDRDVQHLDVAANGSRAVLMAWDTLYTLELKSPGARPVALSIQATEDERDQYEIKDISREADEAALSPDGKVMAYVAYGDVYVRTLEDKSPTLAVTRGEAREKHIAWSPDGLRLYFVSDRRDGDSIFAAEVASTRGEVKDAFASVVDPPPAAAEKIGDEDTPGVGDEEADKGEKDQKDQEEEKAGQDADEPVAPAFDPKRWQDALTFTVVPVVVESTQDRSPLPSPNGKSLAYQRGRGDLMILDLEKNRSRRLVAGWDTGLHWAWSPDSRHVAYSQADLDFNRDIWIAPADASSDPINVTRHPDNDVLPRFSADGRILAFLSERVAEENDVWMVYLDAELETYTPQELATYYDEAVKAAGKRKPLKPRGAEAAGKSGKKNKAAKRGAKKEQAAKAAAPEPVEWNLDDAWLRLRQVTGLPGSEGSLDLTPAGDRYVFTATVGERGLYSVKWDGSDRKKLAGSVSVQGISLDGKRVVFVDGGRAGTVSPTGEKPETYALDDKIRIDLQAQSSQKFAEAARVLGEQFYHPDMKGLDWPKLTERYQELASRARTADEFNDVANRFLGELNASHLRIRAPDEPSPNRLEQGRLGTIHARVTDGFEVRAVIPESPAAKGGMALLPGDVITAIQGRGFSASDTVESLLAGRVDEETRLTLRRSLDGKAHTLQALITPIGWGAERQLRYEAWRHDNARRVAEWSGGRIGYIHIQGMNQSSLDVFERDLYAAAGDKDGLIIDVRNNGGGWTTDRLLASIMVQEHAYTIPRGADPEAVGHYPQDRLFIQRYTLPINMLCNEKSFSNAEIISHAFKTLGRGTLVGQQTYGAVISTGGTRLIDGTTVRLPFRGWYLPDGTDMENHGAIPDIVVEQTPDAEARKDDEQLRAAVNDLIKRLPSGR